MLETLETRLSDKSWTDTQEPEFIQVLESITKAVHSLATRTYIMADLIDKFYDGVIELFSNDNDTATTIPQNGNVYPEPNTNFSGLA